MKISDIKDIAIVAVLAYGVYWLYKRRESFNPMSDQNLAYQSVNAAVQALTNEETLGAWIYNFLRGHQEYDSYAMRPYTKADGTRGVFVTQVIRRSDGKIFNVVDGLFGPTLEAA